MQIDATINALEAAKRLTVKGGEYWMARDMQEILAYGTWDKFQPVIEKAMAACEKSGVAVDDQFHQTVNMVEIGSGAQRGRSDVYLTRYACYLIAMNGESSKAEVGSAQTYFAVQTRRQEIADANLSLEDRVKARRRVTESVIGVNSAAKNAGVQNFGLFQDAGIRGLYSMGLRDIKARKGLADKDDLFDRASHAELAANDFRLTQTREKLILDNVQGEAQARATHNEVGKKVRDAMRNIGGKMPEDMAAEPSLKQLTKSPPKRKLTTQPKLPRPAEA